MRVCFWCGSATPVYPDAPFYTLTRTGACVPCDDDAYALCMDCMPEVQALLQAHAWGEDVGHA